MIFLGSSSPISSIRLLCCIVDVERTIQGSQIPLWVQHKRKFLISMRHPVYKQTADLFSDETTRIAWLYEIWLDTLYNPFAGMLYSPGYCLFSRYLMWETDRHYIFHTGTFIWKWWCLWFLAAFGLTMCPMDLQGALKIEGFMKWVATSAKLSWNSRRSSHSHWCASIAWKLISLFAFLGSFISRRWIGSCRANGHGYQDWRRCKFKPCVRVVPCEQFCLSWSL